MINISTCLDQLSKARNSRLFEEAKSSYSPIFIDPGRKSVFTAVGGLDTAAHSIIRCTTKEYYHYTGSTRFAAEQKKLKKANGVEEIESRVPTAKTASVSTYNVFMVYIFANMNAISDHYSPASAKFKFYLYQGRQRAPEIMANMLVSGGSKYNKKKRRHKNKKKKRKRKKRNEVEPIAAARQKKTSKFKPIPYQEDTSKVPLIVFGDGMFGKDSVKLKRNRCGVTGKLWRALKARERQGELIAVTIDEYCTSKICNSCRCDSLEAAPHIRGHGVLGCKTCNILWQRDVNAAKNMMAISINTWTGNGRLSEFARKTKKT